MIKRRIWVIICTKDRPVDLANLFESIKIQTRPPDNILVIDGSEKSVESMLEQFKERLNISYYQVLPPGLTKQRNYGISKLDDSVDWVGFLDDDLVLEKDAIENLEKFVDNHQDVAGIGLAINNQPIIGAVALKKFFMTDDGIGGHLSPSGIPTPIRPIVKDQFVEWIYGGATFWRKDVLKRFKFDEWFTGVAYLEDVDFSYAVSKKHPLALCASARCFHYHHPLTPDRFVKLGTWRIVAWWYFISKYSHFPRMFVFWSMLGVFLNNLIVGIIKWKSYRILRALGNLKGFYIIASGKHHQTIGFQK